MKVLAAIQTLGYRPNETARSLARSQSHLIGMHVGDGKHNEASILDPFMRELARLGEPLGYRLVLNYSPSDHRSQLDSYSDLLARGAVDGVVITQTSAADIRPAWLHERGLPFVAFGRPWVDSPLQHSWVDVDGTRGLALAVGHLRERGHTRIAHLTHEPDNGTMDDRAHGWAEAMRGTEGFADLLVRVPDHQVAQATRDLLCRDHPTAITCGDDLYAFHALHAIADVGMAPGVDVAVVGYDDSYLARLAQPGLTSLAQPLSRLAELVWDSLIRQIHGDDAAPIQQLVPPELVVRESSTAALAAAVITHR